MDADSELAALELLKKVDNRDQDEDSIWTFKKVNAIYLSLARLKFQREDIELGLTQNIGRDIAAVLDWLCLNLPHESLPEGFTDKNYYTEERHSAPITFVAHANSAPKRTEADKPAQRDALEKPPAETVKQPVQVQKKGKEETDKKAMSQWILNYLEQDEENEIEQEKEKQKNVDPTEKYFELKKEFEQLKDKAAKAKQSGDKKGQSDANQKLRDVKQEMSDIESKVDFKRLEVMEDQAAAESPEEISASATEGKENESAPAEAETAADDGAELGMAMFDEGEATASAKPEKQEETIFLEPNKSYKIERWSGKTPKQIFTELCRREYACAPKFERISSVGGVKLKVKMDSKKKMEFSMEERCDTMEEATNYVSTLALYKLNPDKPLYQLLPPPFRSLWMEWLEQEANKMAALHNESEKIRTDFISSLLEKVT
eukprot:TRINITY_DN9758_c0_g1_i1.p1 TRINITY_DN9758_c0_g1~~TRINITY_DN9758_c0_g1_i1.p1  ORF type:complete len:501 (+),score=154.50 TRINITY_DN9758_c0_g1_i1:208-1503(+)